MEIKVQCGCGQKFKFDVEPMNGQMPFMVNCPICGADGTMAANQILASALSVLPSSIPESRIQVSRPVHAQAPAVVPAFSAPPPPPPQPVAAAQSKPIQEFNLGLGILGAFLGACTGAGLMYGFYQLAGFRFPLLGIGIGLLTGYGARLLFKGTDNKLGLVAGAIALVGVVGTLYLMYGEFPLMSIISVIVSVSMAYRLAAS